MCVYIMIISFCTETAVFQSAPLKDLPAEIYMF